MPGTNEKSQKFGELAVGMKFITGSQLEAALARQQKLYEMLGVHLQLADMLIEQGIITPSQRDQILARQAGRRVIGNYELLKKLGEGGMGAVFLARQISMDRNVALKLLSNKLTADPVYRDQFLSEVRAVARLDHPNIVRGYDIGFADGCYYFAMEYVPGRNLADRIRGGKKVPWRRTLSIGLQCASALKHASDRGIIHRDIKPENLLVRVNKTPAGKTEFEVKLADLGLAWLGDVERGQHPNKVFGTPHYLSPEQAVAASDIDLRTDMYSLGLTLYRLLTGRRPFEKKPPRKAMAAHLKEILPSPKEFNSKIPDAFCRVLETVTAKKREERYPSWEFVIHDLEQVTSRTPKLYGRGIPRGRATIAPPGDAARTSGGFSRKRSGRTSSAPAAAKKKKK